MRLSFRILIALMITALACGGPDRDRSREGEESTPRRDGGASDAGNPKPDGGGSDAGDDTDADTDAGSDAGSDDGGTVVTGPAATIQTPEFGAGLVTVGFRLFHPDSEPLSITVRWSEDGSTWKTAALTTAVDGLESSPEGTEHELIWNSSTDIPGRLANVRLRLTPLANAGAGDTVQTEAFAVDNRRPNTAPSVTWSQVANPVRGDAKFRFVVSDQESDSVTPTVQYKDGSGTWKTATLNPPLSTMVSSTSGVEHEFTWSSALDLQENLSGIQLRVQVDDGIAKSPWISSGAFDVLNAPGSANGVQITEVGAGTDGWIELENFGTSAVDLRSWSVRASADPYANTIMFPDSTQQTTPLTLNPGGRVVVSSDWGTSTSTTIYLGIGFSWKSGGAGSLELFDSANNAIDFVRWGGSSKTPDASGWTETKRLYLPHDNASLKRTSSVDHDNSSDFCAAPATRGMANTTPCYPEAPAASKVRLSEVSAGADGGIPSPSEAIRWIELINTGTSTDLTNWSLVTTSAGLTKIYLLRTVQIAANGRLVVRQASTGFDSTGVQYAGSQAFELRPGGAGAVWLADPTGKPIDFLRWGGSTVEPPAPMQFTETTPLAAPDYSVSLARISGTSVDQSAASWCTTQPTAGAMNGACFTPPTPVVLINEVATGSYISGTFAFIEIRNAGTGYVAIQNWQLRWGGSGTPSSGTWNLPDTAPLAPGERRVYYECGFTSNPPAGCRDSLPWGQLFGDNKVGYVELLDTSATAKSMDFMRWGGSTATPSGAGGSWSDPAPLPALSSGISGVRSFARTEANADTNTASDWCFQNTTAGTANTGLCR